MNSAALLLIPLAGLLAWITHASLTLSGSGPRWARWGARWGCLGLVPLACVATWVWHYYFVPPATDTHIYALRDIDVYPLVSIFFGLLAWVVFLALEPLVSWLGTRRERARARLSLRAIPEISQGSAKPSGPWWRFPVVAGVCLVCLLAVTGLGSGSFAGSLPTRPAEQARSQGIPTPSGPQISTSYAMSPEGTPISKVTASQPCAAANLVVSALGSSKAMGGGITTVEAISTSDIPCNLEGFAQLTLFQGGKDLHLKIIQQPKSLSPAVPPARRIGLARGDRAAFNVQWKGYGAAADRTTPETLWFSVNGSKITPIRLDSRPAPFDLIDGAEVTVTRWFYLGPH